MPLPTLHLIAPHYSTLTPDWLHDGHTDRAFRFSRMMQEQGWRVIEYSAGESESACAEKVSLMPGEDHTRLFPPLGAKQTRPNDAPGSQGHTAYAFRLTGELSLRVQPGDFVCHTYGDTFKSLVSVLPNAQHIEIGIGYKSGPFGAWRIFDSQAWRHYHWGRDELTNRKDEKGCNHVYSWVIPNPHDPEDWPVGDGAEDTVVYFGRLDSDKGMPTIVEIIREHAKLVNDGIAKPLRFSFAGRGDFDEQIRRQVIRSPNPLHKDNGVSVRYMGPLTRVDAARFLGSARCILAPTQYIEPLGNTTIEAMFCGTPVLASDFGGFTETIRYSIDGFRCRTLGDWLTAIEAVRRLDRSAIADYARARFSTSVCGQMYDEAFHVIADLAGAGWYSRGSHRITYPPIAPPLEHPDEQPKPSDPA